MKEPYSRSKTFFGAGFAIVEVIVAFSIVSILLLAFTLLMMRTIQISRLNIDELGARLYVQELIEVAKDLEQTPAGWAEFPATCPLVGSGIYHPVINAGAWELADDPESIGIFTRSLAVEPVFRDILAFPNEIVFSGGVCDPNTKKITATIVWGTHTMQLEAYVYNL